MHLSQMKYKYKLTKNIYPLENFLVVNNSRKIQENKNIKKDYMNLHR